MKNKFTNVLLCTSVMQVINFKCLLEKRNILDNSNNYVVLTHEALNEDTKHKINYFCELFKFKKCIDLTKEAKNINNLLSLLVFTKSLVPFPSII